MRKAKTLLGLNIVSQLEGKHLGSVRDIIFDENSHKLVALLLSDRNMFGMIDATVIPWSQVREIGPNAIMVPSEDGVMKAHADPIIAEAFDSKNQLDGKKVTTQGGEDLGRISDLYINDNGQVQGFEVSGGLFADAIGGKRYMEMPSEITVGEDVVLVPQEIARQLEAQRQNNPGGLTATVAPIGAKATELYDSAKTSAADAYDSAKTGAADAYDSAKTKVTETYESVANASVEKQREYVIGKVAARDVILPSESATMATPEAISTEAVSSQAVDMAPGEIPEVHTSTYATATDVSSDGEVVDGEVLVRKGETITAAHADRAINAGILHQLMLAAGASAASDAVDSTKSSANSLLGQGQEAASDASQNSESSLEQAAIGKPSAREIAASDGSIIVAPGMIVTREILDRADADGKKGQVIAAAGMGAVSEGAQQAYGSAKETAGNIWDTIKEKAAELSGSAQEKKEEYDERAEQSKINNALGRPTTRVILSKNDDVILNTGELITNKAINSAREAGVLDILLDSVYTADPEITPEMLRAQGTGTDALSGQVQPTDPAPTSVFVSQDSDTQNN